MRQGNKGTVNGREQQGTDLSKILKQQNLLAVGMLQVVSKEFDPVLMNSCRLAPEALLKHKVAMLLGVAPGRGEVPG